MYRYWLGSGKCMEYRMYNRKIKSDGFRLDPKVRITSENYKPLRSLNRLHPWV